MPPIRKFAKYVEADQKEMFKLWMTGPMKPIIKARRNTPLLWFNKPLAQDRSRFREQPTLFRSSLDGPWFNATGSVRKPSASQAGQQIGASGRQAMRRPMSQGHLKGVEQWQRGFEAQLPRQ